MKKNVVIHVTRDSRINEDPGLRYKFELMNQGPLESVLERLGLAGASRKQVLGRIALCVGLAWVPPVAFGAVAVLIDAPQAKITLANDFAFHLRFLLALPLLIVTKGIAGGRCSDALQIFHDRQMISDPTPLLAQFAKRRDSRQSELFVIIVSIAVVLVRVRGEGLLDVDTWRTQPDWASALAGYWHLYVSTFVYDYLVIRWLWKFALWCWLLKEVALSNPALTSHHPDRLGGLSFLLMRHVRFAVVAFSVSIVVSGNVAELIYFKGQRLQNFGPALGAYAVIMAAVFFAPLLMFSPLLIRSKRAGLVSYGEVAVRHARVFEGRWERAKRGQRGAHAPDILGVQDFSSLTDLASSYRYVEEMRAILFSRSYIRALATLIALPLAPLVLFLIPLSEIFKKLATAVL